MNDKLPQQDYGTCKRNVQLKIDESFAEKVIPANDSVRLLEEIVEEMDIGALMRAYSAHGRKPAAPPRTMLKIVLYAGMEHIDSSRKIQNCCERDINYIWLLDGAPAPSHFEIAQFRSKRLAECAEEWFGQLENKVDFPFVHGRGKRKRELQRDIEQLRSMVDRKQKYTRYNETFRGRNRFSNKIGTVNVSRIGQIVPSVISRTFVVLNVYAS